MSLNGRFRLIAFEKYLHELVKSVYCAVIKDMLFLGSYSSLSSAYHCIFHTFYKESRHFTRSGGIQTDTKQNNLKGLIDFFHRNKVLL